jgi:hypothetical protein
VVVVATCDWEDDAYLDQWKSDTCQYLGKCGGATWPRHGHPCGTQSIVVWKIKIFLGSMSFEPMTYDRAQSLGKFQQPTCHV